MGFWAKVDRCWNYSRSVAWSLTLSAMGLALWASISPRSPGVAIGLLAVVAGVMSVRPKMHPAEKFAWVFILIAFAVLEVRAIGRSDADNLQARNDLNTKLEGITTGLERTSQELNVVANGIGSMAQNLAKQNAVAQSFPQVKHAKPPISKRFISVEKLANDLRGKETSSATVFNDGTNEAGNFANQLVIGLIGAGWVAGGNNVIVGNSAFFPDPLIIEVSSVVAAPDDHSLAEAKSLIAALAKEGVTAELQYTQQALPSNFMRIKVAGQ